VSFIVVGLINMSVAWSKLSQIREYVPIADLRVSLNQPMSTLPLIGESPQSTARFPLRRWFKTGPQQYICVNHEKLAGFAWAASDGAFAYVLTDDPYFDDEVTSLPPSELLPDGQAFDWPSVARIGRESGDRHFLDIEFYSQRRVGFERFAFYYRHTLPLAGEAPICIKIVPTVKPWIDAQLGAAPNGSPPARPDNSGASGGPPSVS
jgi:hypothetical protein